jgi:signal transduction histidine kinase
VTSPHDEEQRLRAVALQNAQSIYLARQRAEEELERTRDAVDRKTEELARSLAMVRATLEATTDGIVVTSRSGIVTDFNAKFMEMWQLPESIMETHDHELLLQHASTLFADPQRFLERIAEIYATLPPETYDVLELADGRVIERFSRIQFVEERNVGRVWSFRDISENSRLLAALKDADRRKDEFLAMLAHELRSPLAPISNAAQILRAKAAPDPEVKWAIDVIERQVQHSTRLVDDLMDVSRITRGRIHLRKKRVDLQSVVQQAVESSRPLIDKRQHELTTDLPSEPIVLEADRTRLAQVFLNLLNNAAKYTDPGGRITLSARRVEDAAEIRVTDNGIGIQPDVLPRVFELFTQADRSLERSEGGLGIGLTLVQRLVQMHGGSVEAHSDGIGRGSEFVVRLPLADER